MDGDGVRGHITGPPRASLSSSRDATVAFVSRSLSVRGEVRFLVTETRRCFPTTTDAPASAAQASARMSDGASRRARAPDVDKSSNVDASLALAACSALGYGFVASLKKLGKCFASLRERRRNRRRERHPVTGRAMCPIKPGAPLPTKPGVYWRDTQRWVEYPLSVSARLADALNALPAEYDGLGSPNSGVPSPRTPPRAADADAVVNIGNLGIGLGDYIVDIRRSVQISPRGFAREVVFVTGRCVLSLPSVVHLEHLARPLELCALCALGQAVMEIYYSHVPAFIAEGKKYLPRHNGIAVKPDLQLNHSLWDIRATTFRAFLEELHRAGGTRDRPRVLLGYHGTPSKNTPLIMKDGFSPRCRRSAGNGAYFSGELSYAVSYAQKAGGHERGDVLLCALLAHGNAAGVGAKADSHLIDAQGTVFVEKTALPLASLRGF